MSLRAVRALLLSGRATYTAPFRRHQRADYITHRRQNRFGSSLCCCDHLATSMGRSTCRQSVVLRFDLLKSPRTRGAFWHCVSMRRAILHDSSFPAAQPLQTS